MAINEDDIQAFLGGTDDTSLSNNTFRSRFRSDSGNVGRSWIDGTVVIYDPEDCPKWLADVFKQADEDGNTGSERVSGVWETA